MVSIRRILCPVDFSEFSRLALRRAIAIATPQAAAVTALHVVPVPSLLFVPAIDVNATMPLGLGPGEREALRQALARFVVAESRTGVPIDVEVVEAPTVHGEIVAQAGRLEADLIVMGTHGRSGFERLMLGSVTEKVLRTARQPVLTVGLHDGEGGDTAASFAQILCAVDFSDCSIAALRYAFALAAGSGAHLTAVTVVEWQPFGYDPLVGVTDLTGFHEAAERTALEHLRKVVAGLTVEGVDVEETVASGKPHHEILRLAAERQADLIVLGIHGKNPVDRLLFGSTAEPVVRRASCPVLTVRAEVPARVARPARESHGPIIARALPCTGAV
jgi:nucleotide-binding universal stress UspA family protein